MTFEGLKTNFYDLPKGERVSQIKNYIERTPYSQTLARNMAELYQMELNTAFQRERDSEYYSILKHAESKFEMLREASSKSKKMQEERFADALDYFMDALNY